MKKYKLWEAIKELEEGKAKEFKYGVNSLKIDKDKKRIQLFVDGEECFIDKLYTFLEWEKVQEPVTFMEALKKGTGIIFKHEIVKEISKEYNSSKKFLDRGCVEKIICKALSNLENGIPQNMNRILLVLMWFVRPNNQYDIINNGKWYIEEE